MKNGRADYALLKSRKQINQPIAFIEVKRMDSDLSDDHREQVFNYAWNRSSVKYAILTNGDSWEVHSIDSDKKITRVFDVSIRSQKARDCAEKLQLLKRSVLITESVKDQGLPLERTPVQPKAPGVKVLSWLIIATIMGVLAGAVFGVRAAQAVLEQIVGPLGAIVVALVVVAASVFIALRLPWGTLSRWLWPIPQGIRPRTAGAILVGLGLGGLTGYFIGLRVAQPFYDVLGYIGWAVFGLLLVGFILMVMRDQPNKRGKWSSRSYSKSRRYGTKGRRWRG